MNMEQLSDEVYSVLEFISEVGLRCELVDKVDYQSVIPNIYIRNGVIEYTLEATWQDLLHEAGHMAVIPSSIRSLMSDNLEASDEVLGSDPATYELYMAGSEAGVISWSYAACLEIGLEPDNLFDAFNEPEGMLMAHKMAHNNQMGGTYGVAELYYLGMIESKSSFPRLVRWVQL